MAPDWYPWLGGPVSACQAAPPIAQAGLHGSGYHFTVLPLRVPLIPLGDSTEPSSLEMFYLLTPSITLGAS